MNRNKATANVAIALIALFAPAWYPASVQAQPRRAGRRIVRVAPQALPTRAIVIQGPRQSTVVVPRRTPSRDLSAGAIFRNRGSGRLMIARNGLLVANDAGRDMHIVPDGPAGIQKSTNVIVTSPAARRRPGTVVFRRSLATTAFKAPQAANVTAPDAPPIGGSSTIGVTSAASEPTARIERPPPRSRTTRPAPHGVIREAMAADRTTSIRTSAVRPSDAAARRAARLIRTRESPGQPDIRSVYP
jgi:hypothetical protein